MSRSLASNWHTPKAERALILAAGHCAYCGAFGVKLTIDHVLAVSQGGGNGLQNLVAACLPCNSSKRGQDLIFRLARRRQRKIRQEAQ